METCLIMIIWMSSLMPMSMICWHPIRFKMQKRRKVLSLHLKIVFLPQKDLGGNKKQLKKQRLTFGFYHGQLKTLPASWMYPKMNCFQLIHLYLMGYPAEGVTALKNLNSKHVQHFDPTGANLSQIKNWWQWLSIMQNWEESGSQKKMWNVTGMVRLLQIFGMGYGTIKAVLSNCDKICTNFRFYP